MSEKINKTKALKPDGAFSGNATDLALRAVMDRTFGLTGEDFLKEVVRSLATLLGLRYAFIGELAEHGRVRTLAVWADGKHCENFTYEIAGTPCENVIGKNVCYYPENVRKSFPKDHMLVDMGVESYLGAPLFGLDGRPVGIMAVLHDSAITNDPDAVMLLLACSTRVASELERKKAEQERLKVTEELEKSIIQRTYDLKKANEVLREQIIERMKAEDALKESSHLYKTLAESAQDLIYMVDRDMKIEYMNGTCLNFFSDGSESNPAGKKIKDIFPPEMTRFLTRKTGSVIAAGRPFSGEEAFTISGKRMWLDTRLTPVFDKGGEVRSVLGVSRDITERMHRAEESRKERDRAQMYLDIAGVMIVYLNASAQVELINRSGAKALGYPEKEILGRNWIESFVPPEKRKEVRACFEDYIKKGSSEDYRCLENHILTRGGQTRLISWTSILVRDQAGKIIGTLNSGEDITERKKNEQEREKLIRELKDALSNVKTLSGLLPICASCKKIRDDKGYWKRIETYISEHSEADFSHGICPDCAKKMY